MIKSEWKDTVLSPLLNGELPTDVDRSVTLLASDVNQAQRFVFESSRLPDIRGASRVLATINEPADAQMTSLDIRTLNQLLAEDFNLSVPDNVIYMGGGGLLALLDTASTAKELKQRMERLYPQQLGIVTVSVVYEEFSVAAIAEDFGECVQTIQMKLNTAKRTRSQQPFFERLPFMRICASCSQRPAVQLDPSTDIQEHPLCHLCLSKVQQIDEGGWGGRERSFWLNRFAVDPAIEPPKELQELGEQSGREIGFVYADGDGVGKWLFGSNNPKEYRQRSQKLSASINRALESVMEGLSPVRVTRKNVITGKSETVTIAPIEIITVGGDDVLMILPANRSVPAARILSDTFAEEMQNEISLSVGIAIGRESTPIRQLYDIATDLLKDSAKRQRRQRDIETALVDFHDVTREGIPSPSVFKYRDFQQYRLQDVQGDPTNEYLTLRPFTTDTLASILATVEQLELPETQLNQLAEILYEGRTRSELYYLYQYSRMNETYRQQLDTFEGIFEAPDDFPWIEKQNRDGETYYASPLRDLALLKRIMKG